MASFLKNMLGGITRHRPAVRVTVSPPQPSQPHGREWKLAFRELLHSNRHLFPPDLADPVMDYARNPLYSADSHGALAAALRRHDTLDLRPTVQELALGQLFSLDGRTVLVKGPLLRKWCNVFGYA